MVVVFMLSAAIAATGASAQVPYTELSVNQPTVLETPADRENFSISPDSTRTHFYLIVTSKTPSQAMHVMMKSPADSDDDVTGNTNDPSCAARKGSTWGRRWSNPVLLQLDPSETGR